MSSSDENSMTHPESYDPNTMVSRRFEIALQTRQFEIELFWKRSLFFWGFIVTAFAAVGILRDHPTLSLLVSGFGFVCSFAWTLVNRGSKYWQEQWESKILSVEKQISEPLFKSREKPIHTGWWGGHRYSVSRIAIAVSDYVSFVWFCIFSHQLWQSLALSHLADYTRCGVLALSIFPFLYVVLLLVFGISKS
jgi:hypothetical protein